MDDAKKTCPWTIWELYPQIASFVNSQMQTKGDTPDIGGGAGGVLVPRPFAHVMSQVEQHEHKFGKKKSD